MERISRFMDSIASFLGMVFGWAITNIAFPAQTSFKPFQGSRLALSKQQQCKKTINVSTRLGRARAIIFCLLLTANCLLLTAQNFPVQVIPQAVPPAPIYLSDYADASTVNSPLRVQIILNDFTILNREIRLKTYFEGNGIALQSNDIVVGADPLFLEGGIPLNLTNVELAPYFQFENITGISPTVYGRPIPEGAYQFCFEVYDALTGNRLSQRSCATTVVFQNEPPFLITPYNNTNIDERNPQNIVFQWTPRHINVGNVEYELSLVEIWDNQINPQAAFLSSPPVFQVTTTATTYVYGPVDPLLLFGKNYAWRVQARAKQGIEEIGLFKNQGFSEIYSFSYAGSCDIPLAINHEVKGSTNANIFWDDFTTEVPEFTVRYRQKKASGGNNEWFLSKTTTNTLTLWDLKAGTTYEYQIQKKCIITKSDWSTAKTFTTFIADDEASVYECGISPDIDLANKEPLPNISSGDKFIAGDFPITIAEVSGSNGRFTGKGFVTIPYLNSIKVGVAFTNVLINSDKQLIEGSVITMYDPSLKNILDIDKTLDTIDNVADLVAEPFEGDNDLDEIQVDFKIDPKEDIKVENGLVIITNPENGATVSEPLGDDMVVVDGSGKVYHIDAGGKVTEGGQIDSGGAITSNNVEGVSNSGEIKALTAKDIVVIFESAEDDYGFDEMPKLANAAIKKEYVTIKDGNGESYTLVHQAVEKGKSVKILANVEQDGTTYALDSIVFKTQQGEKIPAVVKDDSIELTLTGSYTYENETIYAVVPSKEEGGKQLTAGAFTLWHLTERAIDVVLVSVNGANIPSGIEADIQRIFKKGATTLNISTDEDNNQLDRSLLGNNAKLDIGESAWLTNYNDEQKAVIDNLKSQIDYNRNTYYLFVFGNDVQPSKPIGGFMPLQRQFGFVFNGDVGADEEGKGNLSKTIAHEIGHGVFALRHPFDQYGSGKESTNWLMDYTDGSLLSHMDWAQLHNPELKFYVFQDEKDGEVAGRTWFTPNWNPFTIKNSSIIRAKEESNRVKGTVPGFRLNNGVAYDARYNADGSFSGYYTEGNPNPFELALILDIKNQSSVYLYETVPGDCANTYLTNYAYVDGNKNSLDFSSFNNNLIPVDIATNCDKELCEEGERYFNSYKDLPTVEGSEEDYLKEVAKLLCQYGSEELIEAQKQQYEAWQTSAKNISQNVQKSFSWRNYYNALARLDHWVSNDIDQVLYDEQRDALFEIAFRLEIEVLELLSLERKLKMFQIMFNGDLEKLFHPDHHQIIAKLTRAIKNSEAVAFIDALESEEYKVDEKLLISHFKNRLSDYFTANSYSSFFEEIIRLAKTRANDGNLKIETTVIWDVEQKDYVLISYVQNRNDFTFSYNEETNKVSIKKCTSCCSGTRGCVGKKSFETLLEGASPFDMIGVTVLNDVSPLASGCSENNLNSRSEICGKMTPVPAIFLEYLVENEKAKRWENFGWNAFNVAITVSTFGEGAAAISAIRAAERGTRVAIALKNGYKLFDFAYTVTDITLNITQSGPYGCNDSTTPEEKSICEKKWEEWKYISYALAGKGGLDLAKSIVRSTAKLSRYSAAELREFVLATQLKKNNKELTEAEIEGVLNELEDIINRNGLQDEYQKALNEVDDVAATIVENLDDLKSWVRENGLKNLTDDEIKGTFDLFEGNIIFSQKALISTKEIVPNKSIGELAAHFNLPANPSSQSLTPYQARVWYSWRKSMISKLVDTSNGLETAAREALEMRNAIRTSTRESMLDTDIADYLNTKEVNLTWEQAMSKYNGDYNEIIQASMRGRGLVDILFKVPK